MAEKIQYLAEFHNRYVTLKMKGSWGYNRSNATIITAISYIEELEVTDMKALNEDMTKLKTPLLYGIDKYGRELEIPIDRILEVTFLDTKDQSLLKGLTWLQNAWANLDMQAIEENESLKEMLDNNKKRYDELIAKGVTVYERRG